MSDIVERLRLCDEQMVALDHLNRPYGLAKSLEHEAADEIERLRAERDRLRETLLKIRARVDRLTGGLTYTEKAIRDIANAAFWGKGQ